MKTKKLFLSLVSVLSVMISIPAFAQIRSSASYRPKTAGLVGRFESLNDSRPGFGSSSLFSIDGFFGWNHMSYEFGPRLKYANASAGGASSSLIAIGGYGDYNIIPNTTAERFVWGGTGLFMIGQESAGGGSGSRMEFAFGGVGKWTFAPTSTSVLRFELVYDYYKTSAGGANYTVNGLVANAGLQTYF